MPDEVRMIEGTHTKLTAYATFFLLLSTIGMDAADTARIMAYRKEPSEPCATDSRRRKRWK